MMKRKRLINNKLSYSILVMLLLAGCKAELQTSTTGNGSIDVFPVPEEFCGDGCYIYPRDTAVTITATAETNADFQSWNGDCEGASTICELVLDSNKSVEGLFSSLMIWGEGEWDNANWQ